MIRLDPVWSDRALSVLRIIAALLFLQHGLAKHFGFPHVASFDSLQTFSLLGFAGFIESSAACCCLSVCLLARWPSSCRVKWPSLISCHMRRGASFRY